MKDDRLIIVNEKYGISSDKNQWTIMRKIAPNINYPNGWKPTQYYSTLPDAVKGLNDLIVRTSDYKSVQELSRTIISTAEMLSKSFGGLQIMVVKR